MMAVIGGSLAVESLPGAGTRVLLTLPWEAAHIAGKEDSSV
jgi:chemotaxis protein histidine kinase CheA